MSFTGICCWLILSSMTGPVENPAAPDSADPFVNERLKMVETQIVRRGVAANNVLEAMRKVPRHKFVPQSAVRFAYADEPLAIGYNQTISQPYIVALMTELLDLKPDSKVLEVGTGSGYQAAILAELCDSVSSIEIVCGLATQADSTLRALGYHVDVKCADGYRGWPEKAPFDGIIVTAAPDDIPPPLIDQLAEGGRLVIPVGGFYQDLKLVRKIKGEIKTTNVIPVRFVPMTGEAEK